MSLSAKDVLSTAPSSPSCAQKVPSIPVISPSCAKDVLPATPSSLSFAQHVPLAMFVISPLSTKDDPRTDVSSSSAEEGNDGGSLAVAGSETGPAPADIPNDLPLVPTFAICDGSTDILSRYRVLWDIKQQNFLVELDISFAVLKLAETIPETIPETIEEHQIA